MIDNIVLQWIAMMIVVARLKLSGGFEELE